MFKDIKINDVNYRIYSEGRIYNLDTNHELSQFYSKDGYCIVGVGNYKNRKNKYVHRLIAEYFVENNTGLNISKATVNHIDYNKKNNNYNNLEWVTREFNSSNSYSKKHKQVGSTNKKAKLRECDIPIIRNMFSCKRDLEISKIYNVSTKTIYDIRKLITWKHV